MGRRAQTVLPCLGCVWGGGGGHKKFQSHDFLILYPPPPQKKKKIIMASGVLGETFSHAEGGEGTKIFWGSFKEYERTRSAGELGPRENSVRRRTRSAGELGPLI